MLNPFLSYHMSVDHHQVELRSQRNSALRMRNADLRSTWRCSRRARWSSPCSRRRTPATGRCTRSGPPGSRKTPAGGRTGTGSSMVAAAPLKFYENATVRSNHVRVHPHTPRIPANAHTVVTSFSQPHTHLYAHRHVHQYLTANAGGRHNFGCGIGVCVQLVEH